MKAVLVAINAKYAHTNLAVRYLRAVLQQDGFPCEIGEYTINQPVRDIVADVAGKGADAILFSCYLWNIDMVRRIGSDLRTFFPAVPIILGGPEVSYGSEVLLHQFPFADAIISGEGEGVICDVLARDRIHGVYCSDFYTNMDSLSFPYPDLDALSHRVLYYESTRGCPYGCSYCLSSADRKLRTRSLPLVFQDLQRFLDWKVMRVKFVDRTFNVLPERAYTIWKYLIEHDNGYTGFQMELGGDLLTPEQLELLSHARPGLFQFEIGVQSTDAATLSSVCRNMDLSRLAENVRRIKSWGNIHCHLDLIAGLPGESYSRFLSSYDDVFRLQPDQLQLGFLKLLRGSQLYTQRKELGLQYSMYAPYEVLCTPEISFRELARLKGLEKITEVYWNSGRFQLEIAYLLKAGGILSPARFFLGLWDAMPTGNVGKYAYYDLLYAYAQTLPGMGAAQLERLSWLIRADICLEERPRKLPEHSAAALTGYRDVTGTVKKPLYGEVFPFDFTNPQGEGRPVLAVFDYDHRDFCGRAALEIRLLA